MAKQAGEWMAEWLGAWVSGQMGVGGCVGEWVIWWWVGELMGK